MSEHRVCLIPAQEKPSGALPDAGPVPHDAALVRSPPERLERLFRHVRTRPEGAYLFDLVRRYRRQTFP